VVHTGELWFDDGSPVRAASAVAPLAGGWLIAQDDATHAAWRRDSSVVPVRVLPSVEGFEVFSEAAGTKHLKPDFEAACEVTVDGEPGVLLLGSGSLPARMRASLVRLGDVGPRFDVLALQPLYERVAEALGIALTGLNLEGACRLGDSLRWFNRGNLSAGLPSASVDLDLAGLMAALTGSADLESIRIGSRLSYDLGAIDGVGLAVTDAVALPDGRVLLSAAAEDTPNAVDDGPVLGAALALALAAARGSRSRLWAATGFLYAAVLTLVPPVVRDDPGLGLVALLWMFAVVWATDIAAYFTGRRLGGPKLWPRVSPKKTWSGFGGGLAAGVLAGLAVALSAERLGWTPLFGWPAVAALSAAASVASQIGDLGESALKRGCDVKDSSHLIPGHGGVMDRVDGFWAVCALVGVALLIRPVAQ
jgi:CDP-diglyceride synthetase